MKTKGYSNDIAVTSLDIAAILVTLHFSLRPTDPVTLFIDEKKRKTFTAYFESRTTHDVFGELTVEQVLGIYRKDAAIRANSDAMLCEVVDHMREKDAARNVFLDIIRPKSSGGLGLVRAQAVFPVGNGWRGCLPLDASPELEKRFKAMVKAVV